LWILAVMSSILKLDQNLNLMKVLLKIIKTLYWVVKVKKFRTLSLNDKTKQTFNSKQDNV